MRTQKGAQNPPRRRRPRQGRAGPAPDLVGLLPIDKPKGPTSMDVVERVRRAAGGAKTGHAGTLDPMATGLLLCCIGRRATRQVERLMGQPKVYEATVDLSAFTDTDDREGTPEPVAALPPDRAAVADALAGFVGALDQVPPAHSAVKVGGRRAYELARRGEAPDLPTRRVQVYDISLLRLEGHSLVVRVRCGRGTYLRSIARDIGRALGTGGHLAALRRTASGEHTVAQAMALDALPERLTAEPLLPVPE
jgi:tRNA pseudouridine55 synthase